MKNRYKCLLAVVIVVLAFLALIFYFASTATIGPKPLYGAEKAEVLQYAEPIVDNLLTGYNAGNHTILSRDFDEAMKNALTEAVFLQNRELVTSKIGMYVSRGEPTVLEEGPMTILIYSAEFEEESGVEVRVVFMEYGDKNLVSGLWFNSPKLRE
jgi:hypothetical protein